MNTYDCWLKIIERLNLRYEDEIFMKGYLYCMDDKHECNNPFILKLLEFILKEDI